MALFLGFDGEVGGQKGDCLGNFSLLARAPKNMLRPQGTLIQPASDHDLPEHIAGFEQSDFGVELFFSYLIVDCDRRVLLRAYNRIHALTAYQKFSGCTIFSLLQHRSQTSTRQDAEKTARSCPFAAEGHRHQITQTKAQTLPLWSQTKFNSIHSLEPLYF